MLIVCSTFYVYKHTTKGRTIRNHGMGREGQKNIFFFSVQRGGSARFFMRQDLILYIERSAKPCCLDLGEVVNSSKIKQNSIHLTALIFLMSLQCLGIS